ncbi:hypothetical protein Ancab_014231 [Ancistrocladus abbreviatus]
MNTQAETKHFHKASYAEVVRRSPQSSSPICHSGIPKEKGSNLQYLEVHPPESGYSWLKDSHTGVPKSAKLLPILGDKMAAVGIDNCFFRPIGGNLVLLSTIGGAVMVEILRENSLSFSMWFETIRPWSKKDSAIGRLVWLICGGIPLHI